MYEESRKFLKAFCKIFEEGMDSREDAIRTYADKTQFTDFIIGKIQDFIEEQFKYEPQKEYFRIDAIGWKKNEALIENPNDIKLNHHLWDLKIAVEHENDPKDWMDEVVKLAHIPCPLRVVIGYLPYHERENADYDRKNLDYISEALQKLDCFDNMKRGEFLIILGNSDTSGAVDKYFNYKGYIFNPSTCKFELLE